jgi:hypothetical protein
MNFIFILILILSTFLAWKRALHLYDLSMKTMMQTDKRRGNSSPLTEPAERPKLKIAQLSYDSANIFHFMQITDLHVSMFRSQGGLAHVEAFIFHELAMVAPDLVLVTGDLTDGMVRESLSIFTQELKLFDITAARKGMEKLL